MEIILITSENRVRELTGVSDNVASKYITSAIREAQDVRLKSVLGSCLLDTLTGMIADRTIENDANAAYRDLADRCQYFLVYAAAQELVRKVSYKVTNAGLVKTSDDNVQNASFSEVMNQVEFYEAKADFYCIELQRWLLAEGSETFPELTCGCLATIRANLRSVASSGIWLGGPRGRRKPKGGGECCR